MAAQQLFDGAELGAGVHGDEPRLVVRPQRTARLRVRAGAANQRGEQARSWAERGASRREIPAPLCHQLLVAHLFLGREIDVDTPLAVRGDMARGGQCGGVALVDDLTHKLHQLGVPAVRALHRRAQAQPPGRRTLRDDGAVALRWQVVRLVEDDQPEAGEPAPRHGGGVVGDDGDGPHATLAAADHADLLRGNAQALGNPQAPLAQ